MSYTNISFESVGELVDYVLGGKELYRDELLGRYLATNEAGIITYFNDGAEDNAFKVSSRLVLSGWLVKQEWYENIPERGVLCRASDSCSEWESLTIIVSAGVDKPYIDNMKLKWKYAEPLTNEEIKAFLVEESSDDWRDSVSEENPVECFYKQGTNDWKMMIVKFDSEEENYPYIDSEGGWWSDAIPVNPKLRIK